MKTSTFNLSRTITRSLAVGAVLGLALTGCSSGTDDAGDSGDSNAGGEGTITLGYLPGWTDGLSLAYLLDDQLGKMGYDIEMEELGEASLLYTALAEGDIDIYTSAAPEKTHASYMEEYGDRIEDLATYYDNGVLTFAVPEYMDDVNSIADLKGQGERFDGEIIGIEPSAGLTERTLEHVMPDYDLEGEYELVTSSTASMLATLKSKIDAEEDVVVTLWRPFWANSAFPVKDLEDPKLSMGEPEGYHVLGTLGFSEEFPEAAEHIANFHLDDEAYGALETLITSDEYETNMEGAVDEWLEDHSDAFPGLLTE